MTIFHKAIHTNSLLQTNTPRKVLTILMTHTEAYSRVNVIIAKWYEMYLEWLYVSVWVRDGLFNEELEYTQLNNVMIYFMNEKILSSYPELVKESHPSKNRDFTPKHFTHGSHKKVWWLCSKGYSFDTYIVLNGVDIIINYLFSSSTTFAHTLYFKPIDVIFCVLLMI